MPKTAILGGGISGLTCALRLAQQGHAFDYYENIEGGHAGTANAAEHAYRAALMLSFARRELMGK